MRQIGKILLSRGKYFKNLKYIALRRSSFNIYYFEFGFNNTQSSLSSVKESALEIKQNLNSTLHGILKPFLKKIGITFSKEYSDFYILKKKDNSQISLGASSRITVAGAFMESGTLGSFVKLRGERDLFMLSNYHVLFTDDTKLGESVHEYSTKKKIGEVFWGLYNESYDIALARVTCDQLCEQVSSTIEYKFGSLAKTPKPNSPISYYGASSRYEIGEIDTTMAHAMIEGEWHINQIFLKDLSASPGDSGSVIVKGSSEKRRDPIGILFAKDGEANQIAVANPIKPLFSRRIKSFKFRNNIMPAIKFESFY